MPPAEIAPGLWRWTEPHPDWRPSARPGSPSDWEREVGCVLYEAPGATVFFDPLVPGDAASFWAWSDARVRGRPVHVLTTIHWHRRSRDAVAARYGAVTSRAKANLPEGVASLRLRGAGETLFWIAEHRALIAGDRILGDGAGGLRLCPESWMSPLSHAGLRQILQPVLALPVERVLVSHGDPVLTGGAGALARLLR